jgi:hypothetical protein
MSNRFAAFDSTVLAALLPFASWTRMGRRPEATLDSGAFYVINLTASNALSWVKPALRACAALQARAALHSGEGCLCMFFCWGALLHLL